MRTIMAVLAVAALQAGSWRSSEPAVRLRTSGDTLHVANAGDVGADLWLADARPAASPYAVKVTLHKLAGRQHEGYGILFGGKNLGSDSAQYSYVMIRGDGAVLVKKRNGRSTPVVRDWHVVPAVHQDDAGHTATNSLEVRVTATEVIVRVNDTEVERVPSRELTTGGISGLRISHQMQVDATGFAVQRASGR